MPASDRDVGHQLRHNSSMHPDKEHTQHQFDHELSQLFTYLMEMSGLVEFQLRQAIAGLAELGRVSAQTHATTAREVVSYKSRLDREVMLIISRRHLAARDLRFVLAMSRVAIELERIGEEMHHMVKITDDPAPVQPAMHWREIADQASQLLGQALTAFEHLNAEWATTLAAPNHSDHEVFSALRRSLVAHMQTDTQAIAPDIGALLLAQIMVRVRDHARKIAEVVVELE